ncbi:MAG: hypothetical protein KBG84_07675 [Planctomycetes bacterium]|nr:hypothetical protein [Planctomycetota bacterium]
MPMTAEFLNYFQSMGLNPAFRPRIEQILDYFEQRANEWMPGGAAESVLVQPVKDVMGNPAFELTVFGADAILYSGVLYLKPPQEHTMLFRSVHKRIQNVRLKGRNFDPMTPDAPVSEASELNAEFQIAGEAKKEEYWARGVNCRHLHDIISRHILSNLA